jgi:hypothetical protein
MTNNNNNSGMYDFSSCPYYGTCSCKPVCLYSDIRNCGEKQNRDGMLAVLLKRGQSREAVLREE